MAWGDIDETETDPFAPLKSSLFKRLDNNPIAIADGAPGAPRVRRNAAIVPETSGPAGIALFGHHGFSGRLVADLVRPFGATGAPFTISFSKNGGASYPDSVTIFTVAGAAEPGVRILFDLNVFVDTLTGAFMLAGMRLETPASTASDPPGISAYQGTVPNADAGVTHVRFDYAGTASIAALIERNGGRY